MILGALQLFVATGWQLLVVRPLLGVAIGSAMLAELSPSHGRGGRLSWLQTMWYVGFLGAVVVAYTLDAANVPWRWILATSAVPAIVTLVLRYGPGTSPAGHRRPAPTAAAAPGYRSRGAEPGPAPPVPPRAAESSSAACLARKPASARREPRRVAGPAHKLGGADPVAMDSMLSSMSPRQPTSWPAPPAAQVRSAH